MANLGTVEVDVRGDFDQFKKQSKSKFAAIGKVAVGAFAAAFAAKKVFDFGGQLINAAEEYGSLVAGASNLVAQQQKALGDEATITTDHIIEQADAVQKLTGFSNEQVLAAQRQLLSFQGIQNVGDGAAAVFDRTTGALADMVASGALSDFNSGAILMGKAIGDPLKGMTALSRSGVVFTEQQKESVKEMVANNDTLGAQMLILDELEKVYGGTAEAQKDSSAVIANAWNDIQVKLGNVLLPILEKVADWVVDVMIPTLEEWWPYIKETGRVLGEVFAKAWQMMQPVIEAIQGAIETVRRIFQRDSDKIGEATQGMFDKVRPILQKLQEIFSKVFEAIAAIIDVYLAIYSKVWEIWGEDILAAVRMAWDFIVEIIDIALDLISAALDVFIGLFTGDWERMFKGLEEIGRAGMRLFTTVVTHAFDAILLFMKAIPGKLLSALGDLGKVLWNAGADLIAGLINGIKSKAGELLSTIKTFLTDKIPGWIKGPLGINSPSKLTMGFGENLAEGMALGIQNGAKDVQRSVDQMLPAFGLGGAGSPFSPALAGAGGIGGGMSVVINNPIQKTTNSGIQQGAALGRLMGV